MKKSHQALLIYSAAHFLVDFLCAWLIYERTAGSAFFYIGLLAYNFCAFALQMPLGILTDRIRRCGLAAASGCLLLLFCLLLHVPLPGLVLAAGLGNALFHIGGGTAVLRQAGGSCTEPGIFVSTGAAGLWLGALLGKSAHLSAVFLAVITALTAILLAVIAFRPVPPAVSAGAAEEPGRTPGIAFPFLCLLLVVCLRSYLGLILSFDWKALPVPGFLLILAVAAGKAAGGLLADRFGSWRTVLVSLAASAVLFLFSGHPVPGILAVLLFNMTMPVTLTALVRLLPEQPGFSFGLLTFALFLGFVPVWLGLAPGGFQPVFYGAAALLSLALMAAAWKKRGWTGSNF